MKRSTSRKNTVLAIEKSLSCTIQKSGNVKMMLQLLIIQFQLFKLHLTIGN